MKVGKFKGEVGDLQGYKYHPPTRSLIIPSQSEARDEEERNTREKVFYFLGVIGLWVVSGCEYFVNTVYISFSIKGMQQPEDVGIIG